MGNCKSIQMRQLLLPALKAVGGQLHLGVFQGTLSPATPLGEVISNDGKPTTFLLGFPADREILFTFFLKEFFFSTRERNNPKFKTDEVLDATTRTGGRGAFFGGCLLFAGGKSCLESQQDAPAPLQ